MGFEQSAVTVTRIDAATLRLTIDDHAGGTEYEDIFDRRQIEGIAAGDLSIRDEASQRLKLFKLLLHGQA